MSRARARTTHPRRVIPGVSRFSMPKKSTSCVSKRTGSNSSVTPNRRGCSARNSPVDSLNRVIRASRRKPRAWIRNGGVKDTKDCEVLGNAGIGTKETWQALG